MNLSFAGCGFLGIYHVGVAVCFKKYAPHILLDKISGASFGAISACCLLCDLPLGEITSDVLRVVTEARAGSLGPFSPSFNIQNVLLEGLLKFLPDDAHKRVSGKLHISLTRVYDGHNVIVSEFTSKEDLMQALMASCFIPVFSGMLPPRYHGIRYMDGGFSDNLPVLDENTITVSPFCGESDICPRDLSSQLFHVNVANTSIELSKQNINRFARIFFPPKPEILSKMCKQGFDDALRFLHRNNLISCTRCLAVQTTFQLQESLNESLDYDPECEECITHRQAALLADLPDTVMTVFQNAIDSTNKGLANWMFRRRASTILSIMAIPYRLPIDVVYATYRKFMSCTPKMSRSLWKLSMELLEQVHGFIYSAHDKSRVYYSFARKDFDYDQVDGHQMDRRHASANSIRVTLGAGAGSGAFADADTFDHILNVTANNEALLAYYYLDDGNKVKVTEIFEMTEGEMTAAPAHSTAEKLEYEAEWGAELSMCDNHVLAVDEVDELADRNVFSDPESEWVRRNSSNSCSDVECDMEQPESDRKQPSIAYLSQRE